MRKEGEIRVGRVEQKVFQLGNREKMGEGANKGGKSRRNDGKVSGRMEMRSKNRESKREFLRTVEDFYST